MANENIPSEGSLGQPIRHPINWKSASFYDEEALFGELERVYDICHGCRRCVNLCHAFPTLFDLIDESSTMEVDGVDRKDYWKVVEHCYLCDLCYMTKCPYVPPHEWNVDFPHLMLRAKAIQHKQGKIKLRDKMLTATDKIGTLAGIPVVAETVNLMNENRLIRKAVEKIIGISAEATLPKFHSQPLRKKFKSNLLTNSPQPTNQTTGRVALFVTCYGNRHAPQDVGDLIAVLHHNNLEVKLVKQEKCCGMPKLELGDFDKVEQLKNFNIPELMHVLEEGWDITAPIPSCVLMFKQELPLLFPDDENTQKVAKRFFDPLDYLMLRHKEKQLNTEFKHPLGTVAYHVPCHQRVQNIGLKTSQVLQLIPNTKVKVIERCSGHDGTYAVKKESYPMSVKIRRPIINTIKEIEADYYVSDCLLSGEHIKAGMKEVDTKAKSASIFGLLRYAYGI